MRQRQPLSDRQRAWRQATRPIRRALQPFVKEYRELLRRLRAEGFRVRWTSPMCPVQLQGHLPSGEAFYFRCRHSTCSLSVAPRRGDPVAAPTWHQQVSRWESEEAGGLTAEEAEPVLRELLALYQQHRIGVASESRLSPDERIQRAHGAADAWARLDAEDGPDPLDELDRIRHASPPTPLLDLDS